MMAVGECVLWSSRHSGATLTLEELLGFYCRLLERVYLIRVMWKFILQHQSPKESFQEMCFSVLLLRFPEVLTLNWVRRSGLFFNNLTALGVTALTTVLVVLVRTVVLF